MARSGGERAGRVAELLGQHRYQLDAKGRIALPGKFRDAFADGLYLTLGQDGPLYGFPRQEFLRRAQEVQSRPIDSAQGRAYARMFFHTAEEVELDKQGRLVIPARLRQAIGLEREAVVIGVYDRMEVWSTPNWDAYQQLYGPSYSSGQMGMEGRQ